jgi:transcriptional regulator with XRE-family HTH domain
MMPFGQTVLFWRTHRGLTQGELAARAHLPQPNLSAIERGSRDVSLRTIRSLALALDVHPGVLVDGLPPSPQKNWSRERLERVARAVAQGRSLSDPEERSLAQSLMNLVRSRRRANGMPAQGPRRRQRLSERAWLALSTRHTPERIQSLLQRVTEHMAKRTMAGR